MQNTSSEWPTSDRISAFSLHVCISVKKAHEYICKLTGRTSVTTRRDILREWNFQFFSYRCPREISSPPSSFFLFALPGNVALRFRHAVLFVSVSSSTVLFVKFELVITNVFTWVIMKERGKKLFTSEKIAVVKRLQNFFRHCLIFALFAPLQVQTFEIAEFISLQREKVKIPSTLFSK